MNDHAPFVNLRVGVGKFYYGSDCIRVLSEEVTRLGGKPFVIGGPTTTPLVMNLVHDSFSAAGITPVVRIHTGACSRSWAKTYQQEAQELGCTVILGIGGGVVHVPMMVFLLGFPPLVAVATSTFVLMVSAAIGVVGHALLAHIVWAPAVAVGCGAIVGAQLGARLARKSKPRLIVILLSCVMVALGCQLVWRGFSL